MGPEQVLPLWVWVDMRVMEMKEYAILARSSELEPHYSMCHIQNWGRGTLSVQDTIGVFSTPLTVLFKVWKIFHMTWFLLFILLILELWTVQIKYIFK